MNNLQSLNEYISTYKKQLEQGDIRVAYEHLRKYVMVLKTHFKNQFADKYCFGNVFPGYMDYTYFYFFDDYLRNKKLRFGVVLNHSKMRFELWLLGQNAEVQDKYWKLLKNTEWNQSRTDRPQYSVLEAVLIETPDFDNQDALTNEISERVMCVINDVKDYIKSIE